METMAKGICNVADLLRTVNDGLGNLFVRVWRLGSVLCSLLVLCYIELYYITVCNGSRLEVRNWMGKRMVLNGNGKINGN